MDRHLISVHLWNRLSTFIPKHLPLHHVNFKPFTKFSNKHSLILLTHCGLATSYGVRYGQQTDSGIKNCALVSISGALRVENKDVSITFEKENLHLTQSALVTILARNIYRKHISTQNIEIYWPAHRAGLLFCNFFDMLTPVPYHHFFSSLILIFIYV